MRAHLAEPPARRIASIRTRVTGHYEGRAEEGRDERAALRPAGRRRRTVVRLGIAGALTVATVAAATIVLGAGGRHAGPLGTPDAAAARLLNQAAVVAEAEPGIHPRAHQYVRVDTVSRQVEFPENNAELRAPGYVRVHDQWWERADGRGYNLLRLAAELPGARVIPHASNALGRSGKAVEFTSRNDPFDESRTSQLIFDARSLRYPGSDTVLTKARSGLPAGTVIDATSVVKISAAGKLPRVRRGTVRPSC